VPDSFPEPRSRAAGDIGPTPPVAKGMGLPWDVAVDDAVAAIGEARTRHGDTFVVDSGDDHYLFTFSPTGVESFYALPEEAASKGPQPRPVSEQIGGVARTADRCPVAYALR
jgi:hypothetical protein